MAPYTTMQYSEKYRSWEYEFDTHGRHMWSVTGIYGPLSSPHGLFTGCLRVLNTYGAVQAPCGVARILFYTTHEQPRNRPHGAR